MTDEELIELWLHGKASRTIEDYRRDAQQFLEFAGKPLAEVRLEDLQAWQNYLEKRGLKVTSCSRKINAVKSLFTFAVEQGYLAKNTAAAIKPPKTTPSLAGRILTVDEVHRLIRSGKTERDRLFLLTIYFLALRISEACNLRWDDFITQEDGTVQAMIHGKRGKIAPVVVPPEVWAALQSLRENGTVFLFPFNRRRAHDIVKYAAAAAKINPKTSAHWLRHAHARHAVVAGAPIHLVRDTLRHANISTTNWYLESFPGETSGSYLPGLNSRQNSNSCL